MGSSQRFNFDTPEADKRQIALTDIITAIREGTPPLPIRAVVSEVLALITFPDDFADPSVHFENNTLTLEYTWRGQSRSVSTQIATGSTTEEIAGAVRQIVSAMVDDFALTSGTSTIPLHKIDVAVLAEALRDEGLLKKDDIPTLYKKDVLYSHKRYSIQPDVWTTIRLDAGKTVPTNLDSTLVVRFDHTDSDDDNTFSFPLSATKFGTQGQSQSSTDTYPLHNAVNGKTVYISRDDVDDNVFLMQIDGDALQSADVTISVLIPQSMVISFDDSDPHSIVFTFRNENNETTKTLTIPTSTLETPTTPAHRSPHTDLYTHTFRRGDSTRVLVRDTNASAYTSVTNRFDVFFNDETGATYSFLQSFLNRFPLKTSGSQVVTSDGIDVAHTTDGGVIISRVEIGGKKYLEVALEDINVASFTITIRTHAEPHPHALATYFDKEITGSDTTYQADLDDQLEFPANGYAQAFVDGVLQDITINNASVIALPDVTTSTQRSNANGVTWNDQDGDGWWLGATSGNKYAGSGGASTGTKRLQIIEDGGISRSNDQLRTFLLDELSKIAGVNADHNVGIAVISISKTQLDSALRTTIDNVMLKTELSDINTVDSDTVEGDDSFIVQKQSIAKGQDQSRRLSLNEYEERIAEQTTRQISGQLGYAKVITANTGLDLQNESSTHGTVIAEVQTDLDYKGTDFKAGDRLVKTGAGRWVKITDVISTVTGEVPANNTAYKFVTQIQTEREDLRLRFVENATQLEYGNGHGSIIDSVDLTDGQLDAELIAIRYVKLTRVLSVWSKDPSTGGRFDDEVVIDNALYTFDSGGTLERVPFGTGNATGYVQHVTIPADHPITGTTHSFNLADSHADDPSQDDEWLVGNPHTILALLDGNRVHPDTDFGQHIAAWALLNNTGPLPANRIAIPELDAPDPSGLLNNSLYWYAGELYGLPDNTEDGIKVAFKRDLNHNDFPVFNNRGFVLGDTISLPGRRIVNPQRHDWLFVFPAYSVVQVRGAGGTVRNYHESIATNLPWPLDNAKFIGASDYRTSPHNRIIISQLGEGLGRYGPSGSTTLYIYPNDEGQFAQTHYTLTTFQRVDVITPTGGIDASVRIPARGKTLGGNIETGSVDEPWVGMVPGGVVNESYNVSVIRSHGRDQTIYTTDPRVWSDFRGLINEEFSTTSYTSLTQEDIPFGTTIKVDWRNKNTERLLRDIQVPSGWYRDLTPIPRITGGDRRVNNLRIFAEYFADTADWKFYASDASLEYHLIRFNYNIGGRAQEVFDTGWYAPNKVYIFRSDHVAHYTQPIHRLKL